MASEQPDVLEVLLGDLLDRHALDVDLRVELGDLLLVEVLVKMSSASFL